MTFRILATFSVWFLVGVVTASAQRIDVTSENIGNFLFVGGKRNFACYHDGSESILGTLNKKRLAASTIYKSIRALNEQEKLEKQLVSAKKSLKKAKKANAKAYYKAKISDLTKELRALNLAMNACAQFTPVPPADDDESLPPPNGGDVNPQPQPEPTPNAPEENQNQAVEVSATRFKGQVSVAGLTGTSQAALSNSSFVFTAPITNGFFEFTNIPVGKYRLTVSSEGMDFGRPKEVHVQSIAPTDNVSVRLSANSVLDGNTFRYHWESSDSATSGYEYSSKVLSPPTITFLGQELAPVDTGASHQLLNTYKVLLSNDEVTWDPETADRLFKTFEALPIYLSGLKASKWTLTNDELTNDIAFVPAGDSLVVRLSKAAINYATPKLVEYDGAVGQYFSKRLHKSVVRFVTNNGNDWYATEKILTERFGVATAIPNYTELTRSTTGETYTSFRNFKPEELVALINMFEEMPEGFHKVDGLNYLVRRRDGMEHPRTPQAAAVAWTRYGYIEFMEKAFLGHAEDTHRLILHEKAHFMWEHVFDSQLKSDWIALGGWFPDPVLPDVWHSTSTTTFVTPYSHSQNPDEDMAESLAYFVLNPEWFESRASDKFNFVRDRIMKGDRYRSQIREDLTFNVYNLYPDYVYPGKIKRVDITVEGAPEHDKVGVIEIELYANGSNLDGASRGYTRVHSPDGKSFVDVWLNPVNPGSNGLGNVLRGAFAVSKLVQRGFWSTRQIQIQDQVGNARYQGPATFGWKMFINNPLEDRIAPKYVSNSMQLRKELRVVEGRYVDYVIATWRVDENIRMAAHGPVHAYLSNPLAPQGSEAQWGVFDANTGMATVEFPIHPNRPSGQYGVPQVTMKDEALNMKYQFFYDPATAGQEQLVKIGITSADEDTTPAEIDLNSITVNAVTLHPEAPNGETLVTIRFSAKDDKSGIHALGVTLRDPQGGSHFEHLMHSNSYTVFFNGDPTTYKVYEKQMILPPGSAPGVWGVGSIFTRDKAGNQRTFSFIETMHFTVNN